MLILTLSIDAPPGQAIGIKEDLAVYLERFGDTKILSIEERRPVQTKLGGERN